MRRSLTLRYVNNASVNRPSVVRLPARDQLLITAKFSLSIFLYGTANADSTRSGSAHAQSDPDNAVGFGGYVDAAFGRARGPCHVLSADDELTRPHATVGLSDTDDGSVGIAASTIGHPAADSRRPPRSVTRVRAVSGGGKFVDARR